MVEETSLTFWEVRDLGEVGLFVGQSNRYEKKKPNNE